MEVANIVSGILAVRTTKQLQIASAALRATAIAGKIAAETAEQTLPANPGPGVGGNLDLTA